MAEKGPKDAKWRPTKRQLEVESGTGALRATWWLIGVADGGFLTDPEALRQWLCWKDKARDLVPRVDTTEPWGAAGGNYYSQNSARIFSTYHVSAESNHSNCLCSYHTGFQKQTFPHPPPSKYAPEVLQQIRSSGEGIKNQGNWTSRLQLGRVELIRKIKKITV